MRFVRAVSGFAFAFAPTFQFFYRFVFAPTGGRRVGMGRE